MWSRLVALAATLAAACSTLPDLECPAECECHFFRVNWVTDCSDSNLTAVPRAGLSLDVYILNMNSNNVTRLQPFPEDIKLRSLKMADNQLRRLARDSFRGLHFLLDADFSGNRIQHVDPDAFKDIAGLITLELQNNPLSHVEGPFLISRSLLYLDLSYCQLGNLSQDFFSYSTALNKLDLSGNPIESLVSGVFDPLYSLEYLQLNECNITHIDDKAFMNMTNLKTLELSGNYLTDVNWKEVLGSLARLETLNLRNSHVNILPESLFENNTYLTTLILSENELKDIDISDTLGNNLRYLETLDLSNCRLRGPLSENAFGNATRLRNLVLTGNCLSASDLAVALSPLTRLHKLSLRNCCLTRLPSDTFHRFQHLEQLDISHNPLNDAFTGLLNPLTALEYLDMGFSNLTYVAKNTFSKMTHLKHLILSGNQLVELESGLFQNLTRLEVLELNDCGLSRAPDAAVFVENRTYTDLQELRLAGNPLQVAQHEALLPAQLARLRTLDMSHCRLRRLPELAFNWTRSITTLRLAGNPLGSDADQENPFSFLQILPRLESLDVSHCNFSRLSPRQLHSNEHLQELRLVGNPWRCDCHVVDMWRWALGRGDLGLLVGATPLPQDKRRRALQCAAPDGGLRTWARHAREAHCAPAGPLLYRMGETPPNWVTALSCVAVVVLMSTVIGTGLALLCRRVRAEQRQSASRAASAEAQKHLTDIELLEQYVQRHRLQNEQPQMQCSQIFNH
ncbi:leucine-rich repeat-containing protein 15-like [Bacillus rossius redtenbacheri]|uniref:leucine-rich repeat-containing protein 15-like n=1 Tax=Bacillus rossius redtenbacheri TaxID=93214 RepID=UPI002FDDA713